MGLLGLYTENVTLLYILPITQLHKRCVRTIKPGHQKTGNGRLVWSNGSSFTLFLTSGRVYVWRTTKKACNPKFLVLPVKYGGGYVMIWSAISWISVGPNITFHGRINAREYVDRLGYQEQPKTMQFFKKTMPPFTLLEEHQGELQHLP
jgi:hypothetical protein